MSAPEPPHPPAPSTLREAVRAARPPGRYWLAFILPVIVFVAAFAIGAGVPERWQVVSFFPVVAFWLTVSRWVRLPPAALERAVALRRALRRVGFGPLLLAVGAFVVAWLGWKALQYQMLRTGEADGRLSTAGALVALGLIAYYLAFLAVGARVAFSLPWSGVTRTVLVVAISGVWPFGLLAALLWSGADPPLLSVLVLAVGGMVGLFVLQAALHSRNARSLAERLPSPPPAVGAAVRAPARTIGRCLDRAAVSMGARPWAVGADTRRRHLEGWAGLAAPVLTFVASAAILAGAAIVPIQRGSDETSPIANRGGAIVVPAALRTTEGLDPAVRRRRDADLLAFYAPVLRLASDERWVAGDAEAYALSDRDPDEIGDGGCVEPARVRAVTAGEELCLELDGDDGPSAADLRGSSEELVIEHGWLYPRIYEIAPEGVPCVPGRPCRLLDYWIFYANNVWRSPTSVGSVSQAHKGDWEHVAVGVDGGNLPLFVAYSAHCGGTWRPWRDAPTVAVQGRRGLRRVVLGGGSLRSHPLAVVARGSHANYASTGRREPEWSCEGWGKGAGFLTEQVSAYETLPATGPIQIAAVMPVPRAERVLDAPWWWGPDASIELNGLAVGGGDHGPESPARKDHYDWPTRQIVGWDCEGDERRCADLAAMLQADAEARGDLPPEERRLAPVGLRGHLAAGVPPAP